MNNLEALTSKIYEEGLEKGHEESKRIIAQAEKESKQLVENANNEAKKILSDAQTEADRISRSSQMEMELKAKQLISDLKQEIESILSDKILAATIENSFADEDFLKSAIIEAVKSWNPIDDLELTLPKSLEEQLKAKFTSSIQAHLPNLQITFGERLKKGFSITKKSEAYKLSFSEDDFIALFSPYLSDRTRSLLFTETK